MYSSPERLTPRRGMLVPLIRFSTTLSHGSAPESRWAGRLDGSAWKATGAPFLRGTASVPPAPDAAWRVTPAGGRQPRGKPGDGYSGSTRWRDLARVYSPPCASPRRFTSAFWARPPSPFRRSSS